VGPLTDAERYRFDLQGYLVRRGALAPDVVELLVEVCGRLDRPVPGTTVQSQRFTGFLGAAPELRWLIDHAAAFDLVKELCGPSVRLDHAYGIQMLPGTTGLGLHGGGTPFDPSQYYVHRGNRTYHGLVAVMYALVDHPEGAGFCCIPGSHKAAFGHPHGVDDMVTGVPMRAGDMVVFTEALTHGTLPWRAEHQRLALLYKYAPGHLCWSEYTGWGPDVLDRCSPRQRLLLQPPSVGRHQPVV
jgi:hypothetical protein